MQKEQSLIELIKSNKLVACGCIGILLILLLDTFVLRPARRAKELEKQGVKRAASTASVATARTGSSAKNTAARAPIKPASPISQPNYPALSPNIVNRFAANTVYPYKNSRNIFKEIDKPVTIVEVVQEVVEEVIEKPDISYHGFFTVGNDRVAILRNSDEVLLTKVGTKVRSTTFKLASITPEKVVISDLSEKLRDFEISLADETESN